MRPRMRGMANTITRYQTGETQTIETQTIETQTIETQTIENRTGEILTGESHGHLSRVHSVPWTSPGRQ